MSFDDIPDVGTVNFKVSDIFRASPDVSDFWVKIDYRKNNLGGYAYIDNSQPIGAQDLAELGAVLLSIACYLSDGDIDTGSVIDAIDKAEMPVPGKVLMELGLNG